MRNPAAPFFRGAALAALLLVSAARAGDEIPDPFAADAPRMPLAWKTTARGEIPAAQTEAIGQRLGVRIERLVNQHVDAGGIPVQVNVARCADEEGAKALAARFVALHGNEPLCGAQHGTDAAEIICANRLVAAKARDVLGWDPPETATWKVVADLVPLAKSDDMQWNRLFNLLGASKAAPEAADAPDLVEVAKAFTFGDVLTLPAGAEYAFAPAASAAKPEPSGDRVRVRLHDLPKDHGVPWVTVTARVPVRPFAATPTAATPDAKALTAPTAAWPADDPDVRKLAADCLKGAEKDPPRRRVERLLAAVRSRVRFGGEVVGSRYGVKRTLAQGQGHCWDMSDVLVTLCRAAGIPAREAGGWVRGLEGHVWVEVLLDGEGWLPVDATTTWLGVSADYVTLWRTDDGRVPFVYRGAPTLERVEK